LYKKVVIQDRVRVPPTKLGKKLEEAIEETIKEEYVGVLTPNKEIMLALIKIVNIGEGIIIHGDGAVYYDTTFEMLAYQPVMHEIVEGEVSEITEFGAFVRIGCVDGLIHVSQVMDDYVSYSKTGNLQGKTTNKSLSVKDKVRARIIAISLKTLASAKIGLTTRQPWLGKLKWIKEEKKLQAQQLAEQSKKEEKGEAGKEKKTTKK